MLISVKSFKKFQEKKEKTLTSEELKKTLSFSCWVSFNLLSKVTYIKLASCTQQVKFSYIFAQHQVTWRKNTEN